MPVLSCEQLPKDGDARRAEIPIDNLVIAGWTGRNKEAMEAHIKELEEIGVARPKTTPIFYRGAADLLTTDGAIEVVGDDSSGEVEFVLIAQQGTMWLGVGSDHTDRKVETQNVSISKQACAKPVGSQLWAYEEVIDHWDQLMLRSWAVTGGDASLYQEGPVTTMLAPEELIGRYSQHIGGAADGDLADGTLMYCGTLAVIGGVCPMDAFRIELDDPVLGRKITHEYAVTCLPNEG